MEYRSTVVPAVEVITEPDPCGRVGVLLTRHGPDSHHTLGQHYVDFGWFSVSTKGSITKSRSS